MLEIDDVPELLVLVIYATREWLKPKFVIPRHYGRTPVLKGTPQEYRGEALHYRQGVLDRLFRTSPRDGRWDDGKSVGLEREVDLRLAAAVFFQIGFSGKPTVTPVDDDLEMVLRTKRRLETHEKVPAPERIAGDDAPVSRLNCHPSSEPPFMRTPARPFKIISSM